MKRYQLCVFDIDGVLNPAGKPVQKVSIQAIEMLESNNIQISYASGKHPWYITGGLVFSGLLRENTIVVGEAGGHVFFPKKKERILYTTYLQDIRTLRNRFYEQKFFENEFWEEPKETLFSLFPQKRERIPEFADVLQTIIQKEHLNIYIITHVDALDAMQKGLSKKVGLEILCECLNILLDEMIAFGDGMNDLEMLSCVGYPVAVGNAEERIKEIVEERGGYISKRKYGEGVLEAVNYLIENVIE